MRKGYLISVTTLYFVAIIILFLGLTLLLVNASNYKDSQDTKKTIEYSKFVSGEASVDIESTNKWCQRYYYYEGSKNIAGYNGLEIKKYCEDYYGKRFV